MYYHAAQAQYLYCRKRVAEFVVLPLTKRLRTTSFLTGGFDLYIGIGLNWNGAIN
jgi:hypothetical protein